MNAPKISVLIPMYNRKQYIEQCIDSALNQTFQDCEIIVRDDGSTDGVADFFAQKYADEISSGKIKFHRNGKNIGEASSTNKLIEEAQGKYIMFLHNDDMYMPHSLSYMYVLAENFKADVVHESNHLTTNPDGVIDETTQLKFVFYDKTRVDDIKIVSNDPFERFNEWVNGNIGINAQNNIFRRSFLAENNSKFEPFGGHRLFALHWIMKAKVLVKTPLPFYIYRDSPYSETNSKFPPERVAKFISGQIELSRYLDKFFATDDFFKDKPEFQYRAKNFLFMVYDNCRITRMGVYKNGITPELNRAVEGAFRKYFGDDAAFPTFLFHWIHAAMFNQRVDILVAPLRDNS